jgi:REP element-mobilizing transposase RayT
MAPKTKPPGTRSLRCGRFSQTGQIYHVTTTTWDRQRIFVEYQAARTVIAALRHEAKAERSETLAFVVMPEHLHWLLQLKNGVSLSRSVNNVKANSAREINVLLSRTGRIWQKGFHDRALRHDEDVVAIARYIIANPVRADIVASVLDYPFWDAIWV